MRLNEFITPVNKEENFYDIWDKIEIECSNILSIMRQEKKLMLRGRITGSSIIYKDIRSDRKPALTRPSISNLIDKWLINHNFKAIRANSLFVTGSFSQASAYGNTFVIFPTNGFDYTYFRRSDDLYNFLVRLTRSHDFFPNTYTMRGLTTKKFEAKLDDFMNEAEPANTELNKALNSNIEIMITNCHYYGIPYSHYYSEIQKFVLT